MIILRKVKYGIGYRDLGYVVRIFIILLYVLSLYIVCLLNMIVRLYMYKYIIIYVFIGDWRIWDLCVFV